MRPLTLFPPAFLILPFAALAAIVPEPPAAAGKIDYNRDIRPIFRQQCTECHGGVKSAGNISFVYREKAIAKGKSGDPAIVPGKPEESELVRRINSTDPDEVMPKPKHGPPLSAKEIATLTQWIKEGAPWSEHWSFVPPTEPAEPLVKRTDWGKSKADRLILKGLEARGLAPSPPAGPAEWLRRVSLDLNGLPPTLEEYTVYRSDAESDPEGAKGRVVDRLLASRQFGERWASVWLDLARYSDTFGFEKDPNRDIWPWRDWVIRAFNADLPYDQFTIKQLAGDLLENPSADDLLATAFHRNTQNNTEGGTDDEEFRTVAVLDRVNTTWTAWEATTFGCVQCHSHPYDPFPHDDYYRFAAFFNNTEDTDLNDDFPRLHVPAAAADRTEAARLTRDLRRRREELNDDGVRLAQASEPWTALKPTEAQTTGGTLGIGPEGRVDASGTLPIGVTYTLKAPLVPGATALRIRIFPDSMDPKKWPERGSIISQLTATIIYPDGVPERIKLREVVADFLAGPYDPQETIDSDAGGFGGYPVLAGPRWCVVTLEQPLPEVNGGEVELVLAQKAASNSGTQACTVRHFTLETSRDARWTEFGSASARVKAWAELKKEQGALAKLGGTLVPYLVERSDPARRDTRVFNRGNRLDRAESVDPGIPAVVRPPEKTGRLTRLDLARWLVSDQNPLTARVLANRLWAELFGHGIVETLEDFGTSGAEPSNPELLDHLALRLQHELHWSIKSFLREIALSAAYGQASHTSPSLAAADPFNRFLARGPRARLTAEMVRDQSLAFAGLLSRKQFGPPVYPPQPEGVWNSVYSGQTWKTSQGEDRYRRAIYTYCKRTSGYPQLLIFDAPTRDACAARRIPTNTPLQALATLNDPAYLEMAQALAKRMRSAGGSPRDQIASGCRLLTLDEPPPPVVESLLKLYTGAAQDYAADLTSAKKLAETPDAAALVLVANSLLNLDAALAR